MDAALCDKRPIVFEHWRRRATDAGKVDGISFMDQRHDGGMVGSVGESDRGHDVEVTQPAGKHKGG
jgi:hypothetical protein